MPRISRFPCFCQNEPKVPDLADSWGNGRFLGNLARSGSGPGIRVPARIGRLEPGWSQDLAPGRGNPGSWPDRAPDPPKAPNLPPPPSSRRPGSGPDLGLWEDQKQGKMVKKVLNSAIWPDSRQTGQNPKFDQKKSKFGRFQSTIGVFPKVPKSTGPPPH